MHRRTLVALGATLAIAAGIAVGTPANAGSSTNGELTITAPDQYIRPGYRCLYPIHFSVTSSDSWQLTLTVSSARGAIGGIAGRAGRGAASGDLDVYLCDDLDPIGAYVVTAQLVTAVRPSVVTTSFVLLKAPTKVSLAVTPASSKTGGVVTFSGRGTYLNGAAYYNWPRAAGTLQYQLKGATVWHTFAAPFQTSTTGSFKQAYRFPFSTSARFRVRVSEERLTARSYSPTVYVSRIR